MLEALSLRCRLSSTLWLNGYLPVDPSGDHLFQAIDVCTLVVVLWSLRRVLVAQGRTHGALEDMLPEMPMTLGSPILATMLFADMDSRPLFDALWMAGLVLGILAVLPQLLPRVAAEDGGARRGADGDRRGLPHRGASG